MREGPVIEWEAEVYLLYEETQRFTHATLRQRFTYATLRPPAYWEAEVYLR